MAWPTSAEVKTALAGLLKVAEAELPALFDGIVDASNKAAQDDLNRILALKGYSAGQIALWDQQLSWGRDLALWWCVVKGAGLGDYDDRFVKALDRRKELEQAVAILIGGVPTAPAAGGSEVGGVSFGT